MSDGKAMSVYTVDYVTDDGDVLTATIKASSDTAALLEALSRFGPESAPQIIEVQH